MDVITALVGIGAIILIGFLGTLLFDKLRVPDVILLFFIGIVIGPLFSYLFDYEIIAHDTLTAFSPYLAALALLIILFDAGLDLKFDKLVSHAGVAIVHTIIVFSLSVTAITVVTHFLFGYPWAVGILLGAILGGTSSALVIPMISAMHVTEETKTILTLESVLTDVLCIVTAIAAMGILSGIPVDVGGIVGQLLTPFAVAGLIGGLAGIFWLFVLKKIANRPFAFMSTLATLFILYAGTEYVGASGAIAALMFGIVLSNKDEVQRIFKMKTHFVLDENIGVFHDEVSFVIRTFFFVYLGMTFSLQLSGQNFAPLVDVPGFLMSSQLMFMLLVLGVILVLLLVIRYASALVTSAVTKAVRQDRAAFVAMVPRGLAAAVLSQLPFTLADYAEGTVYHATLSPFQGQFLNITFLIIIFTVLISTVGVYLIERRCAHLPAPKSEEELKKELWLRKSRAYARTVQQPNGFQPAPAPQPKAAPAKPPQSGKPAPAARAAPPQQRQQPAAPQPSRTVAASPPPQQSQRTAYSRGTASNTKPALARSVPPPQEQKKAPAFQSTVVMVLPPVEKKGEKDEDD